MRSFLGGKKGVVVRDNFIHDVDGEANNNAAGIYLTGADNTVVENNLLVDNYDRQKIGNQNNRHIVIFGSRNVRILDNEMRNTIPNAGVGVEFKLLGPPDAGWLQALLGRSQNQVLHHSGATEGDQSHSKVEAGRFLVFYLVQDATTDDWSRNNPTNHLSLQPHFFVSVEASNPDRFDHLRERSNSNRWKLEWENLDFGGDKSFRDMGLDVNFAEAIPSPPNPNAVDDVFRLYSGEGAQRLEVLKNDVSAATITATNSQDAGSLAIASEENAIEFTPSQGFFGYVQFSYTLMSQGVSSTANVQVDVVKRWRNPMNNLDVNADGLLTPLDALVVINALNRAKPSRLLTIRRAMMPR